MRETRRSFCHATGFTGYDSSARGTRPHPAVQTAKRVLLELLERFSELVACFLHLAPQTRRKAVSLTLCF